MQDEHNVESPLARGRSLSGSVSALETRRNQNACDACRGRKIKCRHPLGETRCSGCAFLDIRCTRDRPRRKRGPPNRYSTQAPETIQVTSPQASVACDVTHPSPPIVGLSPTAPWRHAQTVGSATPSYASGAAATPVTRELGSCQLSLLLPHETMMRILEDWFEKIHAVAPILLRRRFFSRLSAGEAGRSRTFCALVVSVCAATIATLPRGDYGHLTVDKCVDFIEEHQLLQHSILRPSYSVDWCIAMYNISASITTQNTNDIRRYHALAEAAAGTRYLLLANEAPASHVDQQILKRLFWLLYAATESLDLFGFPSPVLISERDSLPYLRPQPLADEQLDPHAPSSPDETAQWHGESTSYVPGLNCLSELFAIWHESQNLDSRSRDRGQQEGHSAEELITFYTDKICRVIDNLPPELRWRGGLSRSRNITYGHDVQMANIFITSFHIRSNVLQKYSQRLSSPSPETSSFHAEEHQRIVDDLLEILYNLPPKVFDANGSSVVPKIRDIGAAYLEQVVATKDSEAHHTSSPTAREKLEWVLRKVEDLDCWNGLKTLHSLGPMHTYPAAVQAGSGA